MIRNNVINNYWFDTSLHTRDRYCYNKYFSTLTIVLTLTSAVCSSIETIRTSSFESGFRLTSPNCCLRKRSVSLSISSEVVVCEWEWCGGLVTKGKDCEAYTRYVSKKNDGRKFLSENRVEMQ